MHDSRPPLLYLTHRIPYPPNKGDKVRSYHLLRHLQKRHRVFLGTFVDHPDDEAHVPVLQQMCPDLHVERLHATRAKLKSLSGLLTGEALSLAYYRHAGMAAWVQRVCAEHALQASVVFSSTMAPYAHELLPQVPMLVDLVDVDSAKWTQYAPAHRWPLSMLYRRDREMVFRVRELLIRQRTQAINALRGHLTEFGQIVPQGAANAARLIAIVEDPENDFTISPHRSHVYADELHKIGVLKNKAASWKDYFFQDERPLQGS